MLLNKGRPALGSNVMTSYTERRLRTVHNTSVPSVTSYKEKVLCFIVGALTVILLPYLHIGEYENPGLTRYKHIYFNSTWRTMEIWIITVVFVLLAYESVKYLVPLLRRRNVRRTMFALYIINLYPHYYSWWSFFSYINESFFRYFYHHMWFAVTEIISTCVVLHLCDIRNEVVSWKALLIVNVNIMHIFVGGLDQFIAENMYGAGQMFHKVRNLGLMVPDALHVVIPLWELIRIAKKKDLKWTDIFYREEILLSIVFVSMGSLLAKLL